MASGGCGAVALRGIDPIDLVDANWTSAYFYRTSLIITDSGRRFQVNG